jgi:hypothetical protein
VTPKKPYITWANSLDEDEVKIGEDFTPERRVYLIGDVIPFDRDVILQPYFKAIFEEELNRWYRLESCAGRFAHPFDFERRYHSSLE